MDYFNLSSRVVMFSICTSLEYDLKSFILETSDIYFTDAMVKKSKDRNKKLDQNESEEILNELDLGDFIEIICHNPSKHKINNENAKTLKEYFSKIIPIRNRVMHTRPLELGDRAILYEVLEEIEQKLPRLSWNTTLQTRILLKNDPIKLVNQKYIRVKEFESNVYHNLPEPEFDDTGYIGRKNEIKTIKGLLKDDKNRVITIIGNGGIGKTAIAVKSLYDLVDDPENEYDAILWISLKTRTMARGEFTKIENSIQSVTDFFSRGEKLTIKDENLSPEQNIINFMQEFKVLLVLDNLETLNSNHIVQFLKEIPGSSKVLITSRHGIGELENRYNLKGLNKKDAIVYFRELAKCYGVDVHKKPEPEVEKLVTDHLYSNPLSIKWFITGIQNGLTENTLISNKEALIEFCMSNVYEKLSNDSKKILQLFLVENTELSHGEIDYFMEIDDVKLRESINNLLSTNMITITENFKLNDMARDYLALHHSPSNDLFQSTLRKRKHLNNMIQQIKVQNEMDPFNPKSLYRNSEDRNHKLSSHYLSKALESSSKQAWEDAFSYIHKAENITPDYFEVYKVKAFIQSEKRDLFNALTSYEIALDKCENDFEKSTVLYLYSIFNTIKLSDFEKALSLIEEAESYYPENIKILLEKSRVLMYQGVFDKSEDILKDVDSRKDELDLQLENIFVSRYGDLLRRRAEHIQIRDIEKKLDLLKKGINVIETVERIDTKTYVIMAKILKEISFLYFDENAMEFLFDTLERHFSSLKSNTSKDLKRMKDILISHRHEIPNNLYLSLKKYVYDYTVDAREIYNQNEGIVVFINGHYGFIANAHNKSIYFNINNIEKSASVGDRVEFSTYKNSKGVAAKNIKVITEDSKGNVN
ncbi:NB-ARC domain-containing protein [Bacillus gobiensis]|uniref:NB-ARC domain-containing protein n=1 Tax=Bacillus gobiensis TaxID=1441095 RepID=UPI003D209E03